MSFGFQGSEWARFYPTILVGACDVIEISSASRPPRPQSCRRFNAILTRLDTNNDVFWIARDGVSQFRVLWLGKEIARCEIAAETCRVTLPLASE
jgi:hypothetical protein